MAKNKHKPPRTVPVGRNTVKSPSKKNKGGKPNKPKTIYRPALGSYDPGLDAQQRAAERGYEYTGEDVARGRERSLSDLITNQQDIGRQKGEVQREYGENLSDLLRSRTQNQQDYQTNLQTIARNFQRLGNQQAQQGRRAGLAGGYGLQAARKRAANQALERAPVDVGFNRFMEGSQLSQTRLGEARQRSINALDRSGGQLNQTYRRGEEDYGVTETRAGRELENLKLDIAAAREAQRQQTQGGGLPTYTPPKPKKPKLSPQQQFLSARAKAIRAERAAVLRARRRAGRI